MQQRNLMNWPREEFQEDGTAAVLFQINPEMPEKLPERLLPWFRENRRDLPWRRDREPYHVWLSEIMLQQTRVEAVKAYYVRFLRQLPTVETLAEADENVLLKLWEGLGYYSRVRNLQKAAQQIMSQYGGIFPREKEEILSLPGIGPYTAGAICSICFEQPVPAVDGNVLRVLSRYLACSRPVTDEKVKKEAADFLRPIYPEGHCGEFTQALMELGAIVCAPNGAPDCGHCPLEDICLARQRGIQMDLPVKQAKKPRRREKRTVFILHCGEKLAVCRRPDKGLLAGLWQLPDCPGTLTVEEAIRQASQWGVAPTGIEKTVNREHIFTHVQWELSGIYLTCAREEKFTWVTPEELKNRIGLPTAYRQFLTE